VAGGAGTGSFPIMEDGYVWITRRDVLALGLATAVAGSLGVASIINAEADQVPPTPGLAVMGDETPPPLLPWGAKPERIRTGKPGTGSDTLHASGQVAAAADTSGATRPRGRYAPKGRTGPPAAVLKTEVTDVVPPEPADDDDTVPPPAPTSTGGGTSTVNYYYNYAQQTAVTDGLYANLSIAKPKLGSKDYHSLAELAVQSADTKQVVEVGWTVDRVVNGDNDPHLFVYHWVNGARSCYNGCGFQQVSTSVKPGDTLANGTAKRFGIEYRLNAWWISFDSEWIGYFPEKLWNDQGVASFKQSGIVQVFGEVAAGEKPCSEMGNGLLGTNTSSAVLGSATLLNGPAAGLTAKSTQVTYYQIRTLSERTFQYGGPGPSCQKPSVAD